MGLPVKIPAVHDAAADGHGVAIHVFRRGVGHDIGAPLKGTAVDRRCKRIVDDERHALGMGRAGKFLNIQDNQGRVCDSLAEYGLRVGAEFL